MAALNDKCSDIHIAEIAKIIDRWEEFACYFSLSQSEVKEIARDCHCNYGQQKREFLMRWRQKNGDEATIGKLRSCLKEAKEDKLLQDIDMLVREHTEAPPISTVIIMSTNTDPTIVEGTANPVDIMPIFKKNLPDLAQLITTNITDFSNRLEAESLIDEDASEEIMSMLGVGKVEKATKLLKAVQKKMKFEKNPSATFVELCEILCRYKTVEKIARTMLDQAGLVGADPEILKKDYGLLTPLNESSSHNYSEFTVKNYGEPKLKDLLHYISEIPDCWESVGIQLEISQPKLNAIRMNISNGGLPKNFFTDVFNQWRDSSNLDVPYSWKTFLEALSSPFVNNTLVADQIAEDLRSRKS